MVQEVMLLNRYPKLGFGLFCNKENGLDYITFSWVANDKVVSTKKRRL
jgi:hypothetical protein